MRDEKGADAAKKSKQGNLKLTTFEFREKEMVVLFQN
jgi:hypothetical protein